QPRGRPRGPARGVVRVPEYALERHRLVVASPDGIQEMQYRARYGEGTGARPASGGHVGVEQAPQAGQMALCPCSPYGDRSSSISAATVLTLGQSRLARARGQRLICQGSPAPAEWQPRASKE